MFAVILAGGKGKRFWPYSRAGTPKQFLDITGKGSMLSLTFSRISRFIPEERILILTVSEQLERIREELPGLPPGNIFSEPAGRNTAPSLAVAAAMVRARGEDGPILCCPADHLVGSGDAFRELVTAAGELASDRDALVTFGIKPNRPATGYGYIEAGSCVAEVSGQRFLEVLRFHEKPDIEAAEGYVARDNFYWNSGIFAWRPSVFLSEWERHLPGGREPLARIAGVLGRPGERETIEREYPLMPSVSVDYGILEKSDAVVVAPASLEWNDVGSWDALFDILPADSDGNVATGELEAFDSRGNLFFNPNGMTAAVGVEDTIVVVRDGIVLVCRRGQSERIKEFTKMLEEKGRSNLL